MLPLWCRLAATAAVSVIAAVAAWANWRRSGVEVAWRALRWDSISTGGGSTLRRWWLAALAVRRSSTAAWAKFWWRAAAAKTPRAGSRAGRRFILYSWETQAIFVADPDSTRLWACVVQGKWGDRQMSRSSAMAVN